MKAISVVGARPNFMKVAPIHRALAASGVVQSIIVHTGQHYDERMSEVFFRQLELPEPDIYLGVGSGSHAQQTARVMVEFEKVVQEEKPDVVIVVGDVNSTLACSLVASKCHIPVAHVEAGLRSNDRRMPEEINRIVTDSISDLLFVTEQSGLDNLEREGVSRDKVHFVGNVMIDSLLHFREKASQSQILEQLGLRPSQYALVTMHRPSNVDAPETLEAIVETLESLASSCPVVFPVHPRTLARTREFGLADRLHAIKNLVLQEPLGYLEFLRLMEKAAVVVTDSGGIQEETTCLGIPCLTIRESTERPITIEMGTNELLPLVPSRIASRATALMQSGATSGRVPPKWDGHAAERIVQVLVSVFADEAATPWNADASDNRLVA